MRLYEGIFIINPECQEEEADAQIEKIKEVIIANKGEVEDVEKWGKRQLTYSIQKKSDGIYYYILFKSDPSAMKELGRRYKLNELLMRFLIVLHDPKVRKISLKRRKRDYIKISPNMDMYIDYKRPDIIGRFLTDRGKIVPRRINGLSSKDQRKITTAIKRARFLAMLPYVDEVYR